VGVIGAELGDKGHALVFGPGRNPINFVSVRDVAALVALCARDRFVSNEVLEIGGPENLGFVSVAQRLIGATGKPGRIKHVPLSVLRAMSILARPFSPAFARQARAAVIMNTLDMTFDASLRERFPTLPTTSLDDVFALQRRSHFAT
jgi:NADH dehydrogenase